MILDREVSTDIMIILIIILDWGNQCRMRRNSQRLFKHIQFLGSLMVMYIQIIVRVIVK